MHVHPIVEPAACPAAEPLLLTIGRAGVLSSRAITAGELETLLQTAERLGITIPPSILLRANEVIE
jgi:hypothetical protein